MDKNPSLPNGNSVFCDDVRLEAGNKTSLMGIYVGTLLFPAGTTFPLTIPKLCIVMNWREKPDEVPDILTFKVYFPDGLNEQVVASVEYPAAEVMRLHQMPPAEEGLQVHGLFSPTVVLQPFVVNAPGRLSVRVQRNGEMWRLGTLTIDIQPVPKAIPSQQLPK